MKMEGQIPIKFYSAEKKNTRNAMKYKRPLIFFYNTKSEVSSCLATLTKCHVNLTFDY